MIFLNFESLGKQINAINLMTMTPKPLKIKEDSKHTGMKNGITSDSLGGTEWKGETFKKIEIGKKTSYY